MNCLLDRSEGRPETLVLATSRQTRRDQMNSGVMMNRSSSRAKDLSANRSPSSWSEIIGSLNIVLAAFLPVVLFSLPSYSFGVIIGPLADHFRAPPSSIAIWSLFWSAGAIAGSFAIGSLVDRFGARCVILAFLPIYAGVLIGQALLVDSIPMLFLFAFSIGVACTGLSTISSGRLIADHFTSALGTALGFMSAGVGMAALLGPVVLQHIVDQWGWREGYAAMGVAGVVLIPFFWLLTRGAQGSRIARPASTAPASIQPILTSRTFVVLGIGTFLFGTVVTGASVNLVLFLGSLGMGRPEAAAAAGIFGSFTVIGRVVTGFALDKLRLHIGMFMALILLGLATCFAAMTTEWLLLTMIALSVFGFAVGAEADCLSFATVRLFGRDSYGRVYGILGVAVLLSGAGFGPVLFGLSVEHLDGYAPAFFVWAALSMLSALAFYGVRGAPYVSDAAP